MSSPTAEASPFAKATADKTARDARRRAVITGIGPITCIGTGVDAFWNGIMAEKSGINSITSFDPSVFRVRCAGEIRDWNPEEFFSLHRLKRLDRYAQFAVVSAKLALDDAHIDYSHEKPQDRIGVSFGTALGGVCKAEEQYLRYLKKGARGIQPTLAVQVFGGSAHSNIAIEFGFRGVGTTNSNSCASGTVSVGEALADAQLPPAQINYIKAHASSPQLNDSAETASIKHVFGDHARRIPVSGTKGYYAHPLGATGAIEAALCALALDRQWVPPTINYQNLDPACDLDIVQNHGRAVGLNYVMSNSFGFGGINACVVMGRVRD